MSSVDCMIILSHSLNNNRIEHWKTLDVGVQPPAGRYGRHFAHCMQKYGRVSQTNLAECVYSDRQHIYNASPQRHNPTDDDGAASTNNNTCCGDWCWCGAEYCWRSTVLTPPPSPPASQQSPRNRLGQATSTCRCSSSSSSRDQRWAGYWALPCIQPTPLSVGHGGGRLNRWVCRPRVAQISGVELLRPLWGQQRKYVLYVLWTETVIS